ncbi:glycosyltransferase family 2 protein [Caballeronia sp. BR00000012568055]|uniref:glycosyltransferase family 2 protein n=1 Tax=Caballeronia sp. BR00000012568055 TaxID=2918761 RepID=UPI0023F6E0AA|nr:glycosyltransferase family 2 protein [Caballeronia sp. BR00000012568055]
MSAKAKSVLHLPWRLFKGFRQVAELRGGTLPAMRAICETARRDGLRSFRSRVARAANENDYSDWIARFDTNDHEALDDLAVRVQALREHPLVSIVVPVYNPPVDYLREMIESVLAQAYPYWELCIADDASSAPQIAPLLRDYAMRDSRIKLAMRSENGHICAASNSAIELATGRFIALLDHDDVLPHHALYMVALYAQKYPHAKMFFSDEDKLTPSGKRVQPYFKSDWNAALMLGQNMFSHLGVFEADLLREVGGFRPGFEGSQDHDLALRCAERVEPTQIVHIRHVLYHWRVSEESTARDIGAKPYVRDASLLAVREHLARCGLGASVEPLSASSSMLRVRFDIPQPRPLVSIIVPTRDRADLLSRCIESLRALTLYREYEIIVVDNGSAQKDALELLDGYRRTAGMSVLTVDAPFNFSDLNNRAVRVAKGELLCLLNNDTEIISGDWLDLLCGYACLPDAGAVGAALWYPDMRLQHGGVLLGIGDLAGHFHHLLSKGGAGYFGRAILAQEVSAVTAACLVVRKESYERVGGLDADHLSVAFNDVDFCLKLRAAGLKNFYVPYAELVHHESATRSSDLSGPNAERFRRDIETMRARWGSLIEQDPYYNPNLALSGAAAFSLAFPPRIGRFD